MARLSHGTLERTKPMPYSGEPTLTVGLNRDHTKLSVELPSGHHIDLDLATAGHTLKRLLEEQILAQNEEHRNIDQTLGVLAHWLKFGVGSEVSPTQQQHHHNENHKSPVDGCPFCPRPQGAHKIKPMRSINLGRGITLKAPRRKIPIDQLLD